MLSAVIVSIFKQSALILCVHFMSIIMLSIIMLCAVMPIPLF
jgi:hypothetical protein